MLLAVLLGVIVPAAVLIGLALREHRRTGALVEEWARERDLHLDGENRAMVSWYLRTSRALRWLGVLAGVVLAPLAALAVGHRNLGAPSWLAAFAGYLLGVVYAEVALRRPQGRRASVRPRRLEEYLSPWARRSQRRTAAFAAVLAVAALAVPMQEPATYSVRGRTAIALGVMVVFVGVEAVQRWLVRRPQPVVSQPLLDADDAIRRQSVHAVAGAGMGLQWLLAGAAMWVLAGSDVQILRWTMWVPALLSLAIAFASCTRYDSGVWQRRRAIA